MTRCPQAGKEIGFIKNRIWGNFGLEKGKSSAIFKFYGQQQLNPVFYIYQNQKAVNIIPDNHKYRRISVRFD